MSKLSPEQQRVLSRIKAIGARKDASPMEEKAAVETGLVESHLKNLPGGDADSAGWRQERASIYKDPTNLDASIGRFFDEVRALRGRYHRAGDLAAAVQRPRAKYRGRYQQQSAAADALLTDREARSGAAQPTITIDKPKLETSFDQAGYDRARRRTIVGNLIAKHDPNSLLVTSGVLTPGDLPSKSAFTTSQVTTAPTTLKLPKVTRRNAGGVVTAAKLISRADAIDAKHLPYQWGGGHSGKVDAYKASPLDCSGAVSAVLGINPRVSGDFESWGRPGAGGNVTVYANDKHVLMKIRGRDGNWHFFGTSASNPGGGAGWIPADKISSDYLKNFTARHQ